jgi:hypothetical protein
MTTDLHESHHSKIFVCFDSVLHEYAGRCLLYLSLFNVEFVTAQEVAPKVCRLTKLSECVVRRTL